METTRKYTRTAMVLHWLVAVLILANIVLGLSADHVSDEHIRLVIDTHKSIGITVLGLFFLRVLWRFTHTPPPLPEHFPRWEKFGAHAAHIALYAFILLMPISGWLHDSAWVAAASHPMTLFYLVPWPRVGFIMNMPPDTKELMHTIFGNIHVWLSYIFYVLFALHVLGALKHEFIDRESVLTRMLPGRKSAER